MAGTIEKDIGASMAKGRRNNGTLNHPLVAPLTPPPGGNFTPGVYGLWGLRAIADYLGLADKRSVMTLYEKYALFMFKRRRGPRWVWWSSPQLVTLWMLMRVKIDRQEYLERKDARAKGYDR